MKLLKSCGIRDRIAWSGGRLRESNRVLIWIWLVGCVALISVPGLVSAQESLVTPDASTSPRESIIQPIAPVAETPLPPPWQGLLAQIDFTAGFRLTRFDLDSPVKGEPFDNSFIGSINRLEEQQDFGDPNLYFQVSYALEWFSLGAGISWDELRIKTLDQNTGDGDIVMDAQILYLFLSVPNDTRFTPFLEIGRGSYDNSFDPRPAWSAGGLRRFDLEDSSGSHFALGLDIMIGKGWCANLYYRQSDVQVDGVYVYNGDARNPEPFTFTTEHAAYGVGLSYTF